MTEQKLSKDLPTVSNDPKTDEMEIDLMDILRKLISIRKTLYKAAGIGLIIGIIVALSIPKQYTVKVTLSPEMGNSNGNNGLAGLAASFLGSGTTVGDGTDALNASLSSDIVSSTPFLLELFEINVPAVDKGEDITLTSYLDTQSSPWWGY
ncbi:Wzz/FepE/Etk N-terminal domain-containing protein, partial [Bacteroides acidifaciens]